jgi:hypothetical protein
MINIDWDHIIDTISVIEGTSVTTDKERWNIETPGYTEIYQLWRNANFNCNTIKWINYYPNKDFDQDIIDIVSKSLNFRGVHRAWISRIDPGYMAPWHWDVDDNEHEYLKHGKIIRYTVMIKDFSKGHVFILNDDYYTKCLRGDLILWPNSRDWHSGINGGMESNYMLHILGY